MSSTAGDAIKNIRALLNDQVGSRYVRTNEQVRNIMSNQMQLIASDTYGGLTKQATACTLVAGTDTYTVAPSATRIIYSVVALIRNSDLYPLRKIPFDAMLEFKRNTAAATGKPDRYAIYEDDSQLVKVVLYPTPSATDTLDAWYMDLPDPLTSDSSVIPFGTFGVKAVELLAAAEIAAGMTEEDLAACKLSAAAAQKWQADGQRFLALERERTARIAQSGGSVVRRYY